MIGEFLHRITTALEMNGVPYMLTGSLASSMYGIPRATNDIDLVIAPTREQLLSLVQLFQRVGLTVHTETAIAALRNRTQFNVIDFGRGWKVDLIVRKDRQFSLTEFDRRQTHEFEGTRTVGGNTRTSATVERCARTRGLTVWPRPEWRLHGHAVARLRGGGLGAELLRTDELVWSYYHSIMKNILTVLLLATGLSAAAQEQPKKPAERPAVMCNTAAYALCIKAPCAKKSGGDNYYACECIMQSGWNLGPGSCEERAQTLTSTYSNNFNPYSATISCPAGTEWALCYGAKCERDPNDPSKATCKCPGRTTPSVVLISRDLCGDPSKVCGVVWSAATPEENKFANEHFYSWMTQHGMSANPPAPACPTR